MPEGMPYPRASSGRFRASRSSVDEIDRYHDTALCTLLEGAASLSPVHAARYDTIRHQHLIIARSRVSIAPLAR